VAFFSIVIITSSTLVASNSGGSKSYNYSIIPKEIEAHFMQLKILGSIVLNQAEFNSQPITELFDLA